MDYLLRTKLSKNLKWILHMIHISSSDPCILKKDSYSVDPMVIRDAAKATALREIDSQKKQFSSLTIMADWKSEEWTYRTLGKKASARPSLHQPIGQDHKYEMRQLNLFRQMVKLGKWIVVCWPLCVSNTLFP